MIDIALLSLFIPTFFLVSITPGLCMTLAMTLGMSQGYRKTLYMMIGELLGVATVAIACVYGVAALIMQSEQLFTVFKFAGGCYLIYLGIQMWQSRGALAISDTQQETSKAVNRRTLFSQGLITAIANPKGWAFMVSLLPPFINQDNAIAPQLTILLSIILVSEFVCMSLYALGGRTLRKLMSRGQNVKRLNQTSGSLMIVLGIWLGTN